jgi:hypothetical protein
MDQIESLVQPLYSYTKPYIQITNLLGMPLSYQSLKFQ